MPLGLAHYGGLKLLNHSRLVQALDGVLRIGVEAGLEFAVGGQADTVAAAAEVGIDGAYKSDVALCLRQAVKASFPKV